MTYFNYLYGNCSLLGYTKSVGNNDQKKEES